MPDDLNDHPLRVPTPPSGGGLNLTVAAAIATIAIGAVLLFVGYWGASDTSDPGEQIPHLASATVPGLALVVGGAVLLLRREHERDREELRALADRFDAVIDWLATGDPPASNGAVPAVSEVRDR